MSRPRVAAVTIGQAPRPDLLEPLLARLGAEAEVFEVGALDGLAADRLPGRAGHAAYPLTTRLRDGSRVTLDEADLAPLVQEAIDRAENAGAAVTLLLCAGGFADVTARGPLIRPFEAAIAHLARLGAQRVALAVPFEGQSGPAARKWAAAGFEVRTVVGDPASIDPPDGVDAIVLDYVGHPSGAVDALRARANVPVVDLGEVGAEAALAALAELAGRRAAAIRA